MVQITGSGSAETETVPDHAPSINDAGFYGSESHLRERFGSSRRRHIWPSAQQEITRWKLFRWLYMCLYAARYNGMIKASERAGLAQKRHDLLTNAFGATIEIGAGTGLNLRHYPSAVTRLVLVEPDSHMRRRLRMHARDSWQSAEIVTAKAEDLPFSDGSFDTAVVTFTLCSVSDGRLALGEISRVLAPGGQLLFLEHVRSPHPQIAAEQDEMLFPYSVIGCHPNRDTLTDIESSMLSVESVTRGEVPMAPEIERPMITGIARRSRSRRHLPGPNSSDRQGV